MSGFSRDWLRQREPLDLRARDHGCIERFASALRQRAGRPLRVLDIAAGSGASFRVLAPHIGDDQEWTLTDNDGDLLAAQADEIARWAARSGWPVAADTSPLRAPSSEAVGGQSGAPRPHSTIVDTATGRWTARGRAVDLAHEFATLDFAAFDAVTTSAFLDLVSAPWLDRFAQRLIASQRPLLAMLSVDGRRIWQPALTDDATVLAAFVQHQAIDKGFGPALGASATARLCTSLRAAEYEVTLARSDWRIDSGSAAVLAAVLDDTLQAACEARPEQTTTFFGWAHARREQLDAGCLALDVGHLDLLALPALPGAAVT